MSELFQYLDLETSSLCRRTCPTCIRNSHPDRKKVASWFKQRYLPMTVIKEAIIQSIELGFDGSVCLSHFNEPLLDKRIPEIAGFVRSFPQFKSVFLVTNGDYITEELAAKLDGKLDRMIVSLYMDEPIKSQRAKWIKSLFKITHVDPILKSKHLTTHFSPNPDLRDMLEKHRDSDCVEIRLRCIINHRRQYLLCCEDVIGNFDLGYFPDLSIKDYWFGEKHSTIMNVLGSARNRYIYPYCAICPKG